MKDFQTYSPERVIAGNLAELAERHDTVWEQEQAHLHELAREIAQGEDLFDILASLPDYPTVAKKADAQRPQHSQKFLSEAHKLLQAQQYTVLCRALYEELKSRESILPSLFSDVVELSAHAHGRIVYPRNSYTDNAYLNFTLPVRNARAAYAHSYLAACEEVFNGHCEYCILPVENAVEGELIGFAKLIIQFDLKIVASCDIAGADASRKTRFALLRRNLLPLLTANDQKNRFFCFSLPTEENSAMADILMAANSFGLTLATVSTLPLGQDAIDDCFLLTFAIGGGELYPFLLYLATVAPQYTPIGIYSHLKQKGT